MEKIWQFYQPSSCLSKKKRLFYLILRGKTLFIKKNAQNQRAKLIFWKWVKLLLYNFGVFPPQFFENLKLNKLVKEERRLDLEDRIWRLKFGKMQFWSYILKNEFESLHFWKASFHLLWGLVGAQVRKTSLLEVNLYTAQASTLSVFIFYLVRSGVLLRRPLF